MSQKRYAFLIGANGPQKERLSSLKYAERDAERLAAALKALPCAFTKVEWTTAASRETTLTKFKGFADNCESSDLLIVHFSGHGLYDEQLYLICNETDITNLDASAIGVDAVKRILRKCKARYKLLVLDCCYAGGAFPGTFSKGEHDIKGVLSHELEGSASIILSACSRLDRARELPSLDGGAGFLSWVLLASCTARFSDVSPDLCSLSIADIWRWMPTALAEVNSSLNATEHLPRPILVSQLEAGTDVEIWLTEVRRDVTRKSDHDKPSHDREHFLKALLADHSSFMRNRLDSFVGREKELAEIRQRIVEKQQTGGYVTITGQAGQGKSSIIAKLVGIYQQECGPEKIAFHFIPFNPGPDHQVGLLRNIMARLILKYDLSDLYVASESRPALRDYFPKVLTELAAKGGQEVIFIDGLDQLEEDATGVRDLSFLPNNPPPGVVFVLGTRPNDTLRPLELLKPRHEYQLPDLSREDFDLILQHRKVQLDRNLADRFYQVMQGNALYLDLVARELMEASNSSPEMIIQRVADNHENIFSFTIERLMRQSSLWESVMYPVLGMLLATREPLVLRHIGQILGVADYKLREGLMRLGGLVAVDGRQRYSLFHLKLQDYLRQDEKNPGKKYIFAKHEEQNWHKRLAQWCEGNDLALIWQDTKHDLIEQRRREYARQHYITHLYKAHAWEQLFDVLDEGAYGREKLRYDPSTRLYAQDLDLGRQAAAWDGLTLEQGIAFLPRLWQYTLLRCSLASRADQYPLAAFRLLVLLKCQQEALGLAELLTDPANKVRALLQIAEQLREKADKQREWIEILLRAEDVAQAIEDSFERARALRELGTALAQAQQWGEAERVIASIQDSYQRAGALRELGTALAQAQQWGEAERVISNIEVSEERARVLGELGAALAQAQQWSEAVQVIGSIESSYQRAEGLRQLATALAQAQHSQQAEAVWSEAERVIGFIESSYEQEGALYRLATALAQAQQWSKAQRVIGSIESRYQRAEALHQLATALAQAQHSQQAEAVWSEAERVIGPINYSDEQEDALSKLGTALAEAQQWSEAERVIDFIASSKARVMALSRLATALTQAQQWSEAERVISNIGVSEERAEALSELGTALAQAQHSQQAEAVWNEAERVIGFNESSYKQTDALSELGTALAQAQQWNEAQQVIGSIQDSHARAKALSELGTALAQAQHSQQAEAVWSEAERVIGFIESSYEQTDALSRLVITLTQAQQWTQAQRVIDSIQNTDQRAETLIQLGRYLAWAQHNQQAEAVWTQAQQVIGSIEHSYQRVWALSRLATVLIQTQQWTQAQQVIDSIEDSDWRTMALSQLETALAQAQQWSEAERVVSSIQDSHARAEALSQLATALALAQHSQQAEAVWSEAERAISSIQNNWQQAEALDELVTALAQAQRWEQAERVIGMIKDGGQRAGKLAQLGAQMVVAGEYEELLHVTQRSWSLASTRDDALSLFPMVTGFIPRNPELGLALYEAFTWIDSFLKE